MLWWLLYAGIILGGVVLYAGLAWMILQKAMALLGELQRVMERLDRVNMALADHPDSARR